MGGSGPPSAVSVTLFLPCRFGQPGCMCSLCPQRPWWGVGLGVLPTSLRPLSCLPLPSPALMRSTAFPSGHITSGPATYVFAK